MMTFFPLYLGPIWLILTPLFIFKHLLDPNQMRISMFALSSFIVSWMALIIFAQKKVSNDFLRELPQRVEKQRNPLVLHFFLLSLIVGSCVLFHMVTTLPVKEALLSQAGAVTKSKYHVFFNEVITSNGLFIVAILLLSLIRQITIGYKDAAKLYFRCGVIFSLVLLHIAGMMSITPGGTEIPLWPFSLLSSSSFFHQLLHKLPLNSSTLDVAFTAHAVLFPIVWIGSIWLWEELQNKNPRAEAWFRIFFIPLAFIHLPLLISPLIGFEKLSHIFLATLGAMAGFAFSLKVI